MNYLLTSIIIGLFCGLVFLNIYFRMKVMRSYRYLSQHNIDFSIVHIFNKDKLKTEILPHYPKDKDKILEFVNHIQKSIKLAGIIIIGIIAAGACLNIL